MAKRGRPKKKKQVTYDSKETLFLLGVVLMGVAIFGLMSYVITDDDSIFGLLRDLVGDVTILFSLFMFNAGLALFGVSFPLTTRKSLISQFIFLIFAAVAVATTADPDPEIAREAAGRGEYGGLLGFELANLSQNYFLLNFTGIVAIIGMLLFLPPIFNQNIAEFFGNLGKGISRFYNWLFAVSAGSEEKQVEQAEQQDQMSLDEAKRKRAMVGDFGIGKRLLGSANSAEKNKAQTAEQTGEGKPEGSIPDFAGLGAAPGTSNSEEQNNSDLSLPTVSKGSGEEGTLSEALRYPNWKRPPVELLNPLPKIEVPKEDVKNNSTIIEQTLASFGIESKVMDASVGPSVTQYALDIALGIKVSKIANLRNDLALALATAANAVRIEVPIAGTSYVGIEVPNTTRRPVFFRELVEDGSLNDPKTNLPVAVGKGISGESTIGDIQQMPHLLIAGATGSGKSVLTVSFITSLLMKMSPDELRLILVDPKQVEFSDFNDIPHLLTPVIVDMDKVVNSLKWAVAEMERRYTVFREAKVRNLEGYNEKKGFSALPYIVIVIDEMADMMLTSGKGEIENAIVRLAQKARATGIHLILATQRPSVNVITGIIKANIPGRIGMSVATNTDSRVILDAGGAESLLGKGDMLFKKPDKNKPERIQGVLITQEEVQRVVRFIREQTDELEYIEEVIAGKESTATGTSGAGARDDLFSQAVEVVVIARKGSASLLQRKLSIGYNRAAKLLDEMYELGVVGEANGSKPRDVLIDDADTFLDSMQQN
ncbi:MAG: DNA translocase FtsK [Candidatus Dojkabacteria bacterium]